MTKFEALHRVHSVEEERALREWEANRHDINDGIHALGALVTDQDAARPLIHKLDLDTGHDHFLAVSCVHARLCRIMPHLADVFAFACWPEMYGIPEWLSVGGVPKPAVEPPGAITRIEGSEG